jgi:chromosome segregation ATPase
LNTLDDRVTKLEREMKDVRRVAGTRLSASVPHEDVELVRVELRTQATVLDALRISQDKHAQEMREGFTAVRSELRSEIAGVRTELRTEIADLRTDVSDLRGELRTEVADLRTDVSDLRTELRDSISKVHDRLRAHDRSLEALHQTQVQQGQEMREGFTTVNLGMAQMTALLTIAIKKDGD